MRSPHLALALTVTLALPFLAIALGCDEPLAPIDVGEGEGSLPIGEGEGGAGEGEGEGAGEGEGGEGEGEGEGGNEGEGCTINDAGDPEKARVVLVGHIFTDDPNVDGTEIRSLTLNGETLVDDGVRLDVHTAPVRIAFTPSGNIALVLGQRGHLVSVRVNGAQSLTIVNEIDLPGAGYSDLRIPPDDAMHIYALDDDSVASEAGVHTVSVGCDGVIAEVPSQYFSLRLANSLAFLPNNRAVLLGGQAVFDPIDDDDIRLLNLGPPLAQAAPFDIFHDFVNDTRIAASPDGTLVAVPNASPFSSEGGNIVLLAVNGDNLAEIDRGTGFSDCAEALFSPDGQTLLVSQAEPNRVAVFDVSAGSLVEGTSIAGVGLAEQMDMITRGSEAGLVLVAATNNVGNVHMLKITGPGQATDLGKLDLGAGLEDIPEAIALQP